MSTWLPEAIVVPAPGQSEADSAIENIQAGRIYVYDRGSMSFALLRAHFEPVEDTRQTLAHFVVRYKPAGGNSPELDNATDRVLTDEDRTAGVVSDRVGYFTSDTARRTGIADIPLREVIIPYEEHGEQKILRLMTSLLDVPAHVIAILYQHRWQVEITQAGCVSRKDLYLPFGRRKSGYSHRYRCSSGAGSVVAESAFRLRNFV